MPSLQCVVEARAAAELLVVATRHSSNTLNRSSPECFELLLVSLTHCELGPVLQYDLVVTVEPRVELLDSFDVHYCRSVDSHEAGWVELTLDTGGRVVVEVTGRPHVENHVIAAGLDPVDVPDANEVASPLALDE